MRLDQLGYDCVIIDYLISFGYILGVQLCEAGLRGLRYVVPELLGEVVHNVIFSLYPKNYPIIQLVVEAVPESSKLLNARDAILLENQPAYDCVRFFVLDNVFVDGFDAFQLIFEFFCLCGWFRFFSLLVLESHIE